MAGQTTPGSCKALRDAASDLRKVIAYTLGRQAGIVDKWMLEPPRDADNRDSNGIPNPLDHVIAIHAIVAADSPERADRLLDWLCRQCGGRFVRPAAGQTALFFDTRKAADLLDALEAELARKRSGKKHNRANLALFRRELQNLVDALGLEEQTP